MAYIPTKGISSTYEELMLALLKKSPEYLENYSKKLLQSGARDDVVEIIRNPNNYGDTFKKIMMR